jgi:multisubunit Na+/H+ antiporter MnhG subunit
MKRWTRWCTADQNRVFAAVMGAVAGAITYVIHAKTGELSWWVIGVGAAVLLVGLFMPVRLEPFRKLWMKFAAVLGAINARILLTAVFAVLVTPVALIMRLLGKRPIQGAAAGGGESYWHRRSPDEFKPERMERQF